MRTLALVLLGACTVPGVGSGTPTHNGSVDFLTYSVHRSNVLTESGGDVWPSFTTTTGYGGCHDVPISSSCSMMECVAGGVFDGSHSAGTVTVTGAAMPISMTPFENGVYNFFEASQPLFAGGETLTIAATGDEVPAFTASTTAPGKARITSPAKSADGTLTIARASGLPISWTGGNGTLTVGIASENDFIGCRFDASAGSGLVPADVLERLPAGTFYVSFDTIAETTIADGDWNITVRATFKAVWADDTEIDGTATLR